MINLRQQTINVNRLDCIEALRKGLDMHIKQWETANEDYKVAVRVFLSEALERAKVGDFSNLILRITAPQNKASEYIDVIELLEVSVDTTLQLDKESYKAFYKNEWPWTEGFLAASSLYKSIGGSL